jgi:hypothetical protein
VRDRRGQPAALTSICRALAEHEKARACPEGVEQARAAYAEMAGVRRCLGHDRRVLDPVGSKLCDRRQGRPRP